MKIINLPIEDDLHKEFKTNCASRGQSIKDALTELVKYYIITNDLKLKNEKHD